MTPALLLAPRRDTPGKHDATGAFQPEARRFFGIHGGRQVHVDNGYSAERRAEHVLDELVTSPPAPWQTIAFFCHGTPSSIQLGFDLRNVQDLARAVAQTSAPDVRVLLYCCSTASTIRRLLRTSVGGDGGFADALRDALCREGATGCRVVGHTTVGHATKNPYVRFFDGKGSSIGGQGGEYVVRPGSALWPRWREALATDFRFHFPYLEVAQIHDVLAADVVAPEVVA
jgi:hypothetical protein